MREKSIQALRGRIIRCILFDLGETLWSRKDITAWRQVEAIGNQRAGRVLRKYIAPELLPPINDEALGERLREALDEHIRILKRWNPEIEANGPVAVMQTLQQLGIGVDDIAFGRAIFEALRTRIPESRTLFSDTLPTLAVLQQRGFLLGVVSNRLYGGKPFQEDLQRLGLLDYFDVHHMAISGDLGIRKPNPAIFLHALQALDVAPDQAAMVGDSLNADILGAQRLGIFAIWKPRPKQIAQVKAYLARHGTSIGAYGTHRAASSPELPLEERSSEVQTPDLLVTDDDLSPILQSRSGPLERYLSGEIRPDLIIEHVSDLLDVFAEAGEQ